MALIDSVYYGYGTDTCLHYTLIDIILQMTQVYIFDFVVQWRLVLLWRCRALLSYFCEIYWTLWSLLMHVGFYWMIIELKWRSVQYGQ